MKQNDIILFIDNYLYNINYKFNKYYEFNVDEMNTFNYDIYDIIRKNKIYLVIEFNRYSNYINIIHPKNSSMSVLINNNFKYMFMDTIKQHYSLLHNKIRINKIKNILICC